MPLTRWQREAADTYADGDYSYIQELSDCRNIGDGLFEFLMVELDPKEGCDSGLEAARRVETAMNELEQVRDRLLVTSR